MRKILSALVVLVLLFALAAPVYATEGGTTPSGVPLSEIERRIDAIVADHMTNYTPGAAIIVVHEGEIIFSRGYGYAEVERQVPVNTATTVFEYGSIGKLFVYVSAMQLVERGLLDLDADIHAYLPEDFARELDFQKTFTVRDLLNHSAGFGENFFNAFYDAESVQTAVPLREGLLASQPPQIFEPGTASSYSNFGSALLAYVVAHISGMEFSDYEMANILAPLGMENTLNQPDWFGNEAFMAAKARGYVAFGDSFIQMPWWYIGPYPAGALRGTAEDLARFAIALIPPEGEPGTLFNSRATLDLMLSPSFEYRAGGLRGMYHGFMRYDGSYLTLGHGGGTQGFTTEMAIVPSHRFGVVVLTNATGSNLFTELVLDLLVGNSHAMEFPVYGNLPPPSEVAGTYIALRRHEGNLMEQLNFLFGSYVTVRATGSNTIEVTAMGMTSEFRQKEAFVYRAISPGPHSRMSNEITFLLENGSVTGFSSSGPLDATRATFGQSMPVVIGGLLLMAVCMLFLLIAPLPVFIGFLRKKDKKTTPFYHLSNGLLASGALLALNDLILTIRLVSTAPMVQSATATPHIWLSYIFLGLTCALLASSAVFYKKAPIEPKRKVFYFVTIAFTVLYAFTLWNGNSLVFI